MNMGGILFVKNVEKYTIPLINIMGWPLIRCHDHCKISDHDMNLQIYNYISMSESH